ncbi:uncharacterized protein LOC110101425 isoform X2 [Dendrobium catenatum]|uniref:uncharacterized protein LOC110101425 isoform X2 n=1 Tax=Dendrobium catenatum TaxID=906689 RepID=UPI0009F4FB47|nr:uncharacterized protein LOC110101425 isoform X2 [Dendrobium catenatum]
MTPRDKELEDRIEEVGNKLTSPPSDVQQLLLLLDKSENLLSRVEQCPPQSMHDALRPSMKALVAGDLLRHSDLDVKIAVSSCLSEITRITAPDAPYDDDLMKEIFGLIVGAFKNLDEMSSRSFLKRVSILETVAKVRSCVLMLDLECDDLILDMFNHFLKTIRPKHSDTVFSSMETVMSLVIEESENIPAKLLSCLLDNLKIDEKNIMSSAKKLAEKVLVNCSLKLKPYLVEAFKGISAPLSDYSKIVAAVCQGNLGTLVQNEMNTSGETQADDSKLSDGTLCNEQPQGSAKLELEVLPGKVVADADRSSKLVMSNGFQMGNGDSMATEQKAEFSQSGVQSRDNDGSRLGDSDNLGSGDAKLDDGLNPSSRKGKKRKALVKLVVNNDHKQTDDEKGTPIITGRRKGRSKEAELSQVDGISFKEETAACSKPGKKNKIEPTPGLAEVSSSVSLHTPNEHDGIRSRKGRLPRSKKPSVKRNASDKAAVEGSSNASGHERILESSQTTGGDFPISELSSKKSEVISEAERNPLKISASKSHTLVEDSKTTPTPTCDSETKHQRQRGRSGSQREVKEGDFSGQKKSAGTKQQKGGGVHVDEEDKEVKLKELVSSRKLTMKESIKDQSHLKDSNESKSRQKHAGTTPELTVGTPKRRKSNEKLIGSKIRVWWPDDERFYDGVVDSFDRSTKKHKILYNDGDVEILLLKKEKWEFIEAETKTGGENNNPDINVSDVKNKKSKGRRGNAPDKTKTDLPLNSPDSTIKTESNDKTPKRKGMPSVNALSDETPKKSSKGRGRSGNRHSDKTRKDKNQLSETANKLDNEKLAQTIKPDPSKSADKVDNDKSKSGSNVGTGTPKIRRKSKVDSSRSSVKSKIGPKSRKKSSDAHDSGVKSKDEDSPAPAKTKSSADSPAPAKTKSSAEGRQKPGGRPGKGSSRKAPAGSTTPRTSRNLNANDTPKSDQPKVEEADTRSTTGKKRKRGKLGR